jgi:hypothetical protein
MIVTEMILHLHYSSLHKKSTSGVPNLQTVADALHQRPILLQASSSSKDGDDVSSVPAHHEQSGDAIHKKINVLHVAVGGVMWRRWGQAD